MKSQREDKSDAHFLVESQTQTGISDERYVFNYPDDANVIVVGINNDWYDDGYIWKRN